MPGPGCETCAQCPEPCDLCAEDHGRAAARAAGEADAQPEHTGPDCWVCAEGRRQDAARAAEEAAAYAPGTVITRGYEPGMSYR